METGFLLKLNISEYYAVGEQWNNQAKDGGKRPNGPEVVCLADELASTLAVMKSLCVLNKSAGIGPAALASVGLSLDNQDCRIKTRGRNTRVILLARIPSALLACLPACRSQGEGKARAKREMGVGEGQTRALQATTMWRQSEAALYAGQLCSDQHSLLCLHACIQKSEICLCVPKSSSKQSKQVKYSMFCCSFKHENT